MLRVKQNGQVVGSISKLGLALGCCLILSLTSVTGFSKDATPEPLVIGFFHRPPYYIKGEKPSGFLVDRTKQILETSGVKYRLEEMSVNRIMLNIKQGQQPFCSIGWYKTPERETFAVFTDAIYRNKPSQVMIRYSEKDKFAVFKDFLSLVSDKKLCPGLAKGFSYGGVIDPLLRKKQVECRIGDAEHENLPKMLVAKRFDYLLVSPTEFDDLVAKSGIKPSDVFMKAMADIPDGEFRFLMCNRLLQPEVLSAINKTIAVLP